MNEHQRSLYERLEALQIGDPGAALPFAARLARDNGWSVAFAERVVAEYRRFLFLAMEAGHPVTPSDEVDQAWHLHLVYTESYWDQLCEGVLGRRLHHGPTRGGKPEGEKFHDWYTRTLESYRRFFGEPPADVWPAASVRFGRAPFFRRVNRRENWIVPKGRVKRFAVGAAALAWTTGLVGCGVLAAGPSSFAQTVLWVLLILAGIFVLLAALGGLTLMGSHKSGRSGQSGSGCGTGIADGSNGDGSSHGDGGGSDGGGSGCGGGGCGGS